MFNTGVGDGTYVLRKDSRIVGLGTGFTPGVGGVGVTKIFVDEGIKKAGTPDTAPPREGQPRVTTGGGASTGPAAVGGRNVPILSLSSSVCVD